MPIIGEHQSFIKSFGKAYRNVDGGGATILGDGSVGLILDAQSLVSGAGRSEKDVQDFLRAS